jgi:thiamine biosynthesis lipoprotein
MYRTASKTIKYSLPFFLIVAATLLGSCTQPARQYDYSILAFGTLIDITLYDVDLTQAEQAFDILQQDFDRYHQDWSPWTNGDLAQLNEKLQQGVEAQIPAHLVPLIRDSMELSRQSNNYYNPAIGKLINLWQFHKYQDDDIRPPPAQKIQALVDSNPRLSDLRIDAHNKVLSTNPDVALNFGAFAKGYAIALSIKRLQALNIHNAIINAGGDLSVIGQHGDRPWNIGIRHPRQDSILASVEVENDESVFTSGDYERFYDYQGKRYHHILDPRTGYPTQDAQSVTVIHQDAGRADAAATALSVAGSKNWQEIASKMGIHLVMLIDANGDIQMTPAMEKRVKFLNKSPTSHIILSKEL